MTAHEHDLQTRITAAVARLDEARRLEAAARQRDNPRLIEHWQTERDRRYETCRNLMRQQPEARA